LENDACAHVDVRPRGNYENPSDRSPGTIRLEYLHEVIQKVFGWTDSHLHQFVIPEQTYGPLDDFDEDVVDETMITLAEVVGARVKRFAYVYDFGDNWEHEVIVEKIIASDSGSEARCVW